jgi:hypothetical protein
VARRDALVGFAGEPFVRLMEDSPVLTARLRELRERALAARLAAERGTAADDVPVRVLAAQLAGAYRVLFGEAFRLIRTGHGEDAVAAALAEAGTRTFAQLAVGLDQT